MPQTAKEIEKVLIRDGWYSVKAKGGHRQYKHGSKPGRVTLPWHKNGNMEIAEGTFKSIKRQAGI